MIKRTEINCTGCRACEQKCPRKCIDMKANQAGFLIPFINEEMCIHCGLCERICPQESKLILNKHVESIYAIKSNNQEYSKNSTSSGLFYIIAKNMYSNKANVFGCVWNDDFTVRHMRAYTEHDLQMMRGSKYLQSDTKNTYSEVMTLLEQNEVVVYSGTGCQISGLYAFLGKDYDNLYTIEILCHGVPSPKLFQKYISWLEKKNKGKITNFRFRDKSYSGYDNGYRNTFVCCERKKTAYRQRDTYCLSFLNNKIQREVCYNCKYAGKQRIGDITIGDFWKIDKFYPDFYDNNGVSVAITNSEKGEILLSVASDEIDRIMVKWEEAAFGNESLVKPVSRNIARDRVYTDFDICSLDFIFDLKLNIPFNILDEIKLRVPYSLKYTIKQFIKNFRCKA